MYWALTMSLHKRHSLGQENLQCRWIIFLLCSFTEQRIFLKMVSNICTKMLLWVCWSDILFNALCYLDRQILFCKFTNSWNLTDRKHVSWKPISDAHVKTLTFHCCYCTHVKCQLEFRLLTKQIWKRFCETNFKAYSSKFMNLRT